MYYLLGRGQAEDALTQINTCHYIAEPQQHGVQQVLKIGLGFRGKEVALASAIA